MLLGQVSAALGVEPTALQRVASSSLVLALPYLLLRLVDDFAGVPRRVMRLAIVGLGVAVAGIVLVQGTLPPPFTLFLVLYFVAVQTYASFLLVRESRGTTGVNRRRMNAASVGSLLLGLAVLAAGAAVALPVPAVVTRLLALGSAVAYALAFVPPAALRRAWQEPDLRAFLEHVGAIPSSAGRVAIVAALERSAAVVFGAASASVALWDEQEGALRTSTGELLGPDGDAEGEAFSTQRAMLATDAARRYPQASARYQALGASSVAAVPVTLHTRRLGVVSVYTKRPSLFAEDDLELLTLLARQIALAVDSALAYDTVQRSNSELASRVEELASLNRRLEEATQAKSEFLANMSHELRTPLNAILGFSDLLAEQLDTQLSAPQRRFLRNVRESGEHLLELINDVLDLSKVEAGRLELRPEMVRLAPLLEPVVASARASADAAGLTFEAVIPDDGTVRVDPTRLRQVLHNLLSNAVKFTPRGGTVRLRMLFEDADFVIEVADTGLGIPASEQHRVFGTFERLHEGRVEVTGTGLGLALTKRLVELHRGSIAFESEEGRGTTFRVVLPETRVEPVHGDRVLVVEDVEADADLIVALAAEAGLQCEVVTTARGAIEAARADPPTGVVLDLRLPDERGERVLEALKAEPRTRAIPVIVVTVEDDEGRSRPLGADDHLTKPIDRQRLAAWLRSVKDA